MENHPPLNLTTGPLEQLLMRAAIDGEFKEALIRDRIVAAQEHGFLLSASERAMLAAIPAAQLRVMIDNISPAAEAERLIPEATRGNPESVQDGATEVVYEKDAGPLKDQP